jgi:hypothetical protein
MWCAGLEADLVYTIEIVAENEKGKLCYDTKGQWSALSF